MRGVEKRIIKQMLLVLCGYFFWKKSSFLKIWEKRWSLPPLLGEEEEEDGTQHTGTITNLMWSDWKQTTGNMLSS